MKKYDMGVKGTRMWSRHTACKLPGAACALGMFINRTEARKLTWKDVSTAVLSALFPSDLRS